MAAAAGTATQQPNYKDEINLMYLAHAGKKKYQDGYISSYRESMKISGFLGSATTIFLSSQSTMEHESPAVVAAPLVHMVAKGAISLGIHSKTLADKVVIFAPDQLSISAKHVHIGNLLFAVQPKAVFITCKTLTLSKLQWAEPDIELFKSWLVNEDTAIEMEDQFFDTLPSDEKK